jgi:hypothetical protein
MFYESVKYEMEDLRFTFSERKLVCLNSSFYFGIFQTA